MGKLSEYLEEIYQDEEVDNKIVLEQAISIIEDLEKAFEGKQRQYLSGVYDDGAALAENTTQGEPVALGWTILNQETGAPSSKLYRHKEIAFMAHQTSLRSGYAELRYGEPVQVFSYPPSAPGVSQETTNAIAEQMREQCAAVCRRHQKNQEAHGESALAEQSRQDANAIDNLPLPAAPVTEPVAQAVEAKLIEALREISRLGPATQECCVEATMAEIANEALALIPTKAEPAEREEQVRKDAERWRTLEYLWFISESIEIRPGDDIDKWELHFDGVECASASWDGGDLAEIVDKIKALFDKQPDEESDAAIERSKREG